MYNYSRLQLHIEYTACSWKMALQSSSGARRQQRQEEILYRAINNTNRSASRLWKRKSPVVRSLVFSGNDGGRGGPSSSTASFYNRAIR